MINDTVNNLKNDDSKDQTPSQFSVRKRSRTTADFKFLNQPEHKLNSRQPSAKDYLNILPELEIEEKQTNKIRFQINSNNSDDLSKKSLQKESINKSPRLTQIPQININHIQQINKSNQNTSIDQSIEATPKLLIRQKCSSFSQNNQYLQSPLLKQRNISKTPSNNKKYDNYNNIKSENELSFFPKEIQKRITKQQDLSQNKMAKQVIDNKAQKGKEQADKKEKRNLILQKKAESQFNLQNLIDFHSKWQLMKNIRNKSFYSANNFESIQENVSQEQDDVRKSTEDLKNDNTEEVRQQQPMYQNNYLDEIQEKDQMENLEDQLAQGKSNKNHLLNKIWQSQKKKSYLERDADLNSSIVFRVEGLKMSDYFFVGSQNSNLKSQQVRLNLSQEPESNRKQSKLINVFKSEFEGSQTHKSQRFSQENQINDIGFKSNINFNSSNLKHSQNQEVNQQMAKNQSQNIQFGLTNVFSTSLEQSVILYKNQSECKGLLSPQRDKSKQTQIFVESSPIPSKSSFSPSHNNSKGKSSEQSMNESRVSGHDNNSKMLEDDLEFQRKRREKSPLNYLFKKYPDAIQDTKYSYMKMQMRQVVENHVAPELSAEKQLIEKYGNYSQNLSYKLRNKLVKESQNKANPFSSKLISLKNCQNSQQKKTFSQLNQLICDVEVAKKQYKFIDSQLSKFNKTITDIDDITVQTSYFNVSDFIYKTQINNRNKQNQINSRLNQNKRLLTE